jgi:hypothetical protein
MKFKQYVLQLAVLGLLTVFAGFGIAADDDANEAPKRPQPKKAKKPKTKKGSVTVKLDRLRAEAGSFLENAAPNSSNYLHGAASINWQPNREWEFQAAARFDGYSQSGTPNFARGTADVGETYVRWRGEDTRLTIGAQNISWARVDEIPPSDRLSRVDASRFILDGLPDRRRAIPALRIEKFPGDWKLDMVGVPVFVPARLADEESVWHPVDKRRGRILGVPADPALAYVITNGSYAEEKSGSGGAGFRATRTGGAFDYGFSLQYARSSLPYYRLNPDFRTNLALAGGNPVVALATTTGPTFTAVYPHAWVAGGELEFQAKGATWRLEAAYTSDTPGTTRDLRYVTPASYDLVAGVEFFPGDGDTRVTMQLGGHHVRTSETLMERQTFYGLNGELEHTFGQGKWRANLRFFTGLNDRDNYVNPKLSYLGFEPHEIYLAGHFFSGSERALGGFHKDHDLLVLGWQVRY